MDFSNNLKSFRKKRKMNQSDLARVLNIGRTTVTSWENGINYPSVEILDKLASILEVSTDDLLGRDAIADKYKRDECTIKLLSNYSKLNDFGKKEALKRVSELTEISKYTKTHDHDMPIAAHNDAVIDNKELKLMQEDIDEL
ncbi:MAG: helix-turn-helix transcriptional regulator [Lachnospiraceae bacterium]